MSDLTKPRELRPRHWWILFCAVVSLPLVHLGLGLLGYERLRRLAEALTPRQPTRDDRKPSMTIQSAREYAALVSIAARRGLYKATCLRRSMLVWWILRARGFDSTVCFGVRTEDGHLEAHAWVEHEGNVIDDTEDVRVRYRPLHEGVPPTMSGL